MYKIKDIEENADKIYYLLSTIRDIDNSKKLEDFREEFGILKGINRYKEEEREFKLFELFIENTLIGDFYNAVYYSVDAEENIDIEIIGLREPRDGDYNVLSKHDRVRCSYDFYRRLKEKEVEEGEVYKREGNHYGIRGNIGKVDDFKGREKINNYLKIKVVEEVWGKKLDDIIEELKEREYIIEDE